MAFPAVISAGAAISKVAGVSFKAPTPRIYGFLPGTIDGMRSSVEGRGGNPNYPESDPVSGVNRLWNSTNSGAKEVWANLLPTWNPTPAARARIKELDAGFVFRSGVTVPVAAVSPIQQALDPLRAALEAGGDEAAVREAAAQVVERVGVGGGAAGAQALRGTSGPLDTLIEFSQKPGGTIILVVSAVAIVILLASVARR